MHSCRNSHAQNLRQPWQRHTCSQITCCLGGKSYAVSWASSNSECLTVKTITKGGRNFTATCFVQKRHGQAFPSGMCGSSRPILLRLPTQVRATFDKNHDCLHWPSKNGGFTLSLADCGDTVRQLYGMFKHTTTVTVCAVLRTEVALQVHPRASQRVDACPGRTGSVCMCQIRQRIFASACPSLHLLLAVQGFLPPVPLSTLSLRLCLLLSWCLSEVVQISSERICAFGRLGMRRSENELSFGVSDRSKRSQAGQEEQVVKQRQSKAHVALRRP